MTVTIRPAHPGDEVDIHRLIIELADYEREPDAVQATPEDLRAHLFGAEPLFAHVAEVEGRVVGMAVWFFTYSTWTGRHGIYLEDLIVDASARRAGAGRALFRALAEEARASECARIDWAVLDWNDLAKDFYRGLGGRRHEGWEPWRLDGDALVALQP